MALSVLLFCVTSCKVKHHFPHWLLPVIIVCQLISEQLICYIIVIHVVCFIVTCAYSQIIILRANFILSICFYFYFLVHYFLLHYLNFSITWVSVSICVSITKCLSAKKHGIQLTLLFPAKFFSSQIQTHTHTPGCTVITTFTGGCLTREVVRLCVTMQILCCCQ